MPHAIKEFSEIADELRRQGWRVEKTGQNHYQAKPPNPKLSIVHFGDSSEARALHNTIGQLRRSGFVWPPQPRERQASPSAPLPTAVADEQPTVAEPTPANDASGGGDPVRWVGEDVPARAEDQEDRLFRELKEARMLLTLEDENLVLCERRLDEARRAHEAALRSRQEAATRLRESKARFDAVFSDDGGRS